MKTMTCRQMHGPCDALIRGETADEMIQNSQRHGMKMVQAGDPDHIRVMEEMRIKMSDPELVNKMMDQFRDHFANTPEDV